MMQSGKSRTKYGVVDVSYTKGHVCLNCEDYTITCPGETYDCMKYFNFMDALDEVKREDQKERCEGQ